MVPRPVPSLVISRLIALNGGVLHLALTRAARGIATTVEATSGYFGAFCWSIMAIINAGQINCTKNADGAHHGSRDYSCHQEAATKKQADLQSKYAGNLPQITISKWHRDILDV
jgi:hypothetical protein